VTHVEPMREPPATWRPDVPHERPPLASYANYFEVGHNAFEFLIDAGQIEPNSGVIQVMSRIAVSPVHAKLLAQLLARSIAQFEASHHAIASIADPECDLTILSPQEFEARAIDARRRSSAGVAASIPKNRLK